MATEAATLALHPKQQAIIRCIEVHQAEYGRAPTYSDLRRFVGISSNAVVNYHLNKLKDRGLVEWEPGAHRTLRVVETEAAT